MKQRLRSLVLVLGLCGALSSAAFAERGKLSARGDCIDGMPRHFDVVDSTSATSCATGGGTYDVACCCMNGTWAVCSAGGASDRLPSWDNPPASAHSYSDEFDSGSLSGQWTISSASTTNAAASGTIDYTASKTTPVWDAATVDGWMMVQSDSSSLGYVNLYESYTASTNATFFARFGWNNRAVNANGEGNLSVTLVNTGDANEWVAFGTAQNGATTSPYMQVNNNGTFTTVVGAALTENMVIGSTYLVVWKVSNVYYFGQALGSKGIFSLIGSGTKTGVTTLDRIVLEFRTANETPSIVDGFDFFRYEAALNYSLVNP